VRNNHTKERPFKCEDCDYSSADPGAVTRHRRQHTGEAPARCTWDGCKYAAKDYSNLGRHMRTHTGERPFACPENCGYKAAQSGSVRSHVKRKHSNGVREFICLEHGCDYKAMTNSDLKKHTSRH